MPGFIYNTNLYWIDTSVFSNVTEIYLDGTFSYCSNLTNIHCPKVTEMDNAFVNCKNLVAITDSDFPDLKRIGVGSFSGCTSLLGKYTFSSVTSLSGADIFKNVGSGGVDFYFPSCIEIHPKAFNGSGMISLHLNAKNKTTIQALDGYPSFGNENISIYWDAE